MAKKLCFVAVFVIAAVTLRAQTPEDFAIRAEVTQQGGTTVTVVGSWKVDGVQGWSWGLCHNADEAKVGDCVDLGQLTDPCAGKCPEVSCPEDMAKPGPDGKAASFHSVQVYDGGIVQAVVLDFTQSWDLDADERFELLQIKYDLKEGVPCTELNFCNTLGDPPVDITFVVNGASFRPAVQEGATIGECAPTCEDLKLALNLGEPQVSGDPGSQTAVIPVLLTTGQDNLVSGLQFGIALDSTDVVIDGIDQGQALTDIGGADFFGVQVVEGGATVGVVVDLEPDGDPPTFRTLPDCTADQEVAVVKIKCAPSAQGEVAATASFTGELGDPQIEVIVDVDGTSLVPEIGSPKSFTLQCAAVAVERFVRGDANQDGKWNVSDGVAIAKAVFGLGSKLALIEKCMDSADTNDDGKLDTADAVYLLEYLFTGGPAIPEPLVCGEDPTDDQLDCPEYPPCAQ